MPTKKNTEQVIEQPPGAADTDDPTVHVSTVTPRPTDDELRTGVAKATTTVAPRPVAPLRLVGEPRIERYERAAPDGTIVEVEHNIDTGEHSYVWTNRRAPRPNPEP